MGILTVQTAEVPRITSSRNLQGVFGFSGREFLELCKLAFKPRHWRVKGVLQDTCRTLFLSNLAARPGVFGVGRQRGAGCGQPEAAAAKAMADTTAVPWLALRW